MQNCQELYNSDKYEECVACCRNGLTRNPEDVQLLFLLAESLRYLGEAREAIPFYDEAIRLNGETTGLCCGKGLALSSLAFKGNNLDNHKESIKYFNKAIQISPVLYPAYRYKSIVTADLVKRSAGIPSVEKKKILEDEITTLRWTIKLAAVPETYSAIGEIMYQLGVLSNDTNILIEALSAIDRSLKMEYNERSSQFKARILVQLGRVSDNPELFNEALEYLLQIAGPQPDINMNRELASFYYQIGEYSNDVSCFIQAQIYAEAVLSVRDSPKDKSALAQTEYKIAKIRKDKSLFTRAIQHLDKAMAEDPLVHGGLSAKGLILSDYGWYFDDSEVVSNAIFFLEEAKRIAPSDSNTKLNLAVALHRTGVMRTEKEKLNQALKESAELLELASDFIPAHYLHSVILADLYEIFDEPTLEQATGALFHALSMGDAPEQTVITTANFLITHHEGSLFLFRYLNNHPELLNFHNYANAYETARRTAERNMQSLSLLKLDMEKEPVFDRTDYLFYQAVSDLIDGDPVTAFHIHDTIIDLQTPEDLRHQYYYVLAAGMIHHQDFDSILSFACDTVDKFYSGITNVCSKDHFYVAGIFVLAGKIEQAVAILNNLINQNTYEPAWYLLMECYDIQGDKRMLESAATKIIETGVYINISETRSYETERDLLEERIRLYESSRGWYLAGMIMNLQEDILQANKVSLVRSKHYEALKRKNHSSPNDGAVKLSAEALQNLEIRLRLRMPRLFNEVHEQPHADAEKLAERMISQMIAEKKDMGSVIFGDYADLLTFAFSSGKINQIEFALLMAYINLKAQLFNKGKSKDVTRIAFRYLLRETISRLTEVLGEVLTGIPVKQLIRLILSNSDDETIREMNFYHFRTHFDELISLRPDEFSDLLDDNEATQLIEGWLTD